MHFLQAITRQDFYRKLEEYEMMRNASCACGAPGDSRIDITLNVITISLRSFEESALNISPSPPKLLLQIFEKRMPVTFVFHFDQV